MGILSWSGRGLIVLPLLILPMVLMFAFESYGPEPALMSFGIGWLLAGVVCLYLGKQWNREGARHRFGRLRLETWGYIFLAFGLLLTVPPLIGKMREPARPHRTAVSN